MKELRVNFFRSLEAYLISETMISGDPNKVWEGRKKMENCYAGRDAYLASESTNYGLNDGMKCTI